MIRLGMLAYGLDRQLGGIGTYTVELHHALELAGQQVMVLHAGRSQGDGVLSLPGARLLPSLLTLGQVEIAFQTRRHDLDIIHDPTGSCPILLAPTYRVVTIHDVIPYLYPQTSTRLDRWIYRYWLPWAVQHVDVIITVSQQSRKDILHFLPVSPDKVMVIPEAADSRFRPLPDDVVASVLQRYDIPKPYILYVGSLAPRKNLPRLLRAYARVREWHPAWRLVIVGARKWKTTPIFATVQQLELEPYVHFTGYVADEDLPALYNGADLFVFPSLYEGFGLPVLEAMACGTPVITSNTSSLPEVAGDAALLVDPHDVEAIAAAMHRVLTDPDLARKLRKKGLARASQFTWERTARETIAVYEKVLGRHL